MTFNEFYYLIRIKPVKPIHDMTLQNHAKTTEKLYIPNINTVQVWNDIHTHKNDTSSFSGIEFQWIFKI